MSGMKSDLSAGKGKRGKRMRRRVWAMLLALMMVLTGLPDMGLGLPDTVTTAKAAVSEGGTLTPGSTFDVGASFHMKTTYAEVFYIKSGGTYTITGEYGSDSTARFVIQKSCTIILDSAWFRSGLSFEDDGRNYNGGTHGIFEVDEGVRVDFVLRGMSRITSSRYYQGTSPVEGILLGKGSTVSFSGEGSLDMSASIARRFYGAGASYAKLIMQSGKVEVSQIGSYKVNEWNQSDPVDVTYQAGMINFQYEGGEFYNASDNLGSKSSYFLTQNCSGYGNRVCIKGISEETAQIRKGADGEFLLRSSMRSESQAYNYYMWHNMSQKQKNTVTDYYVIDGGSYRHFQDTFTSALTDAVEVTDESSIGGAAGTVKVAGAALNGATLTFKGDAFTGSCTTDASGSYYKAMPKGTYHVFLTRSGEKTENYVGDITVATETKHTFDFSLSQLTGRVTKDRRVCQVL